VRRIVWLEQYSAADRGVLGGEKADGNTGPVTVLHGAGLGRAE